VQKADRFGAREGRRFLAWTAVSFAAMLFCYAFVDRPLATFLHGFLADRHVFVLIARDLILPTLLAVCLVIALASAYLMGWPTDPALRALVRVVLIAAIALCVAENAKDIIKYMVGRTWPETLFWHNPSWNENGVYAFAPFHGGLGFESFPSGHTTALMTLASVLACAFPRWRALWMLPVALVALALVATDIHWLSDVIGGAYLGSLCGFGVARVARLEPIVFAARGREAGADEATGGALEPAAERASEPAE